MNRKICPVCKSGNVTLDLSWLTGKYRCKNCGYLGPLILEKENKPRKKKMKPVPDMFINSRIFLI